MKKISISNLFMSVRNKKILNGINLVINEGEQVSIIGPNGAGKTTLVNTILGLQRYKVGKVENDFLQLPPYKIGVHMQDSKLNELMTVKEVLDLFLFEGSYKELVNKFGLNDKMNQRISTLSGGEKQRLQLIVALQNNPEILFLDEITTGLDANSRREITRYIIEDINKKNKTIVMITHYFEEVESLTNRIVVLYNGEIIEDGKLADLYEKYNVNKIVDIEFTNTEIKNEFKDFEIVGNHIIVYIHGKKDMTPTLNIISKNSEKVIDYTIKDPHVAELYDKIIENHKRG